MTKLKSKQQGMQSSPCSFFINSPIRSHGLVFSSLMPLKSVLTTSAQRVSQSCFSASTPLSSSTITSIQLRSPPSGGNTTLSTTFGFSSNWGLSTFSILRRRDQRWRKWQRYLMEIRLLLGRLTWILPVRSSKSQSRNVKISLREFSGLRPLSNLFLYRIVILRYQSQLPKLH